MIKKILNNKSKTIASAAIILGAASFVSRLLGLVRDRILAGTFGAGDELDIYYAAFRIPDLVYSLLVVGAISAGFIPVFVDYLYKDRKKSWHLANSMLNLMALSLLAVSLILIIFAPWILKLITPGFSDEKLSITVQLTRIMFLSPFFMGLSAVFGGILQSFRRFLVYSLGPIMYNLGIIFGVLFLVEYFGILGLAYGVVLGAFLHMAVQIPTAYLCGYRWQNVLDYSSIGIKRIFKMMPPRVINLALYQFTVLVMTILASFLAAGSIAIYNLSYNIISFPLGIFGVSFSLAAFPQLSEAAQKKDKDNFVHIFSSTVRQILFFILPASVVFIILKEPIIRIILGSGQFDLSDILITSQTLACFAVGLFAQSLIFVFLRGFFAWEDAKTPLLTGFWATLAGLASALLFSKYLGVAGLALAFSLSCIIHLILLFIFLKRKIGFLDSQNIFVSGLKMLLSSLFSGLAIYLMFNFLNSLIYTDNTVGILIKIIGAGIIGMIIYFLFGWIFRIKELKIFFVSLKSRLSLKKIPREIGENNGR